MVSAAVLALSAAACTSAPSGRVRVIDLVHEFNRAEVRPARDRFQLGEHTLDGTGRLSIAAPVPSRAIWVTPMPRRAALSFFAGVQASDPSCSARFRIGISDDRIYETLASHTATHGNAWTEMRVDLSRYAGWKFSIFYQPDGMSWRLVLSLDQTADAACTGLWGTPAIETDPAAAHLFVAKQRAGG